MKKEHRATAPISKWVLSSRAGWKRAIRFVAMTSGLLSMGAVHAAEFNRYVTISGSLAMAATRPASIYKDVLLIYINSAAWGASTCRQDAVVIQKTDSHLLAQLWIAELSGKTIVMHVDDALRPFSDNMCQVTMVQVVEP